MKKRIIILCVYPQDRVPGLRFRIEQYLPVLEQAGFEITFSSLFSTWEYARFTAKGNTVLKAWLVLKGFFRRLFQCITIGKYDVGFIYREVFVAGPAWFEKFITKRIPCVYDFDDAIWLQNVSVENRKFAFLKNTGKISTIISRCKTVVAGNEFLAKYALQFNHNVHIIPTTIDTQKYHCTKKKTDERVCIGWSGSADTIRFFKLALPALVKVQQRFGQGVYFKIIGDKNYYCAELQTKAIAWNAVAEVSDLCEIDIGIMPLLNDDWARGKCALKGLQYMSLGIATVMAPAGVNSEIITDGVNGFLTSTDDEWVEKISLLVTNASLRKQLGDKGKQTVIEHYSVLANKEKWVAAFRRDEIIES